MGAIFCRSCGHKLELANAKPQVKEPKMDDDTIQQVKDQITEIVGATAAALEATLESGLYTTVAKAQYAYYEELRAAGFGKDAALQILASHNILQAHGS